jgi:hypothetical protein
MVGVQMNQRVHQALQPGTAFAMMGLLAMESHAVSVTIMQCGMET